VKNQKNRNCTGKSGFLADFTYISSAMTPQESALSLLEQYYACFNAGDTDAMLGLLDDDVIHDINQGGSERGIAAFREFFVRMNRCYRETLAEIQLLASEDGTRAAAEFVVHGHYLATDEGLPEAAGQTYVLPAGAFFSLKDGKIARVTMYYNLEDWLQQVHA
jgi:steroid delta-isomerase-like uncharacterized protein